MTVDPDLALVVGLVLALLSLLSFAAAWVDGRRPWTGAAILCLGLALIGLAVATAPQAYGPHQLLTAIYSVIGRYIL